MDQTTTTAKTDIKPGPELPKYVVLTQYPMDVNIAQMLASIASELAELNENIKRIGR